MADHLSRITAVLQSDRLLVFYVKLGDLWLDDYKFETALRLLPFQDQTRIISKKFSKDAHTALANQLLMRFICSLMTNNTAMKDLKFERNKYGKPGLKGSEVSFSMSNQRGYTSMVVSLRPGDELGIDLASVRDVDGIDGYVDHFKDIFHANELEHLKSFDDSIQRRNVFTHFWALKESYTKKLGVGLNGDLGAYEFTNVYPLAYNIEEEEEDSRTKWDDRIELKVYDEPEKIKIYSTMIDEEVIVSVCSGGMSQPLITPLLVEVPLETIVKYFESL